MRTSTLTRHRVAAPAHTPAHPDCDEPSAGFICLSCPRHRRQPARDLLVAAGGGVLVDERCRGVGMAQTVHQLGEGRTGLGGHGGASVTEVVPAHVRTSGDRPGSSVDLVQRAALHVAARLRCGNEDGTRDPSRERLYVGLSRATDRLVVFADPDVIRSIGGS